jgi:predicted DNA-binding transcriptional regulator AlpA
MADSIRAGVEPLTYDIGAVSTVTGIPRPTIYEHARRDPSRWGVIRFGRAIRFRRDAIDRLVAGEPSGAAP